MSAALVLGVSFGYLLLLFAIAAFADRRATQGRTVIDTPLVYALSLAVYCSAWTYFGSVGRAAAGGVWFLPIYLGPMVAMLLAGAVILRMIRIARTYRITSIADFIASRYGKSPLLAACVTLITVVGIVPYIALQLEAVSTGYRLMTAGTAAAQSGAAWWRDTAFYMALALAAFTILFGTRHLDSAERHEGMVAAIAFESVVKLAAFLAVGVFVTWGLFAGPADIWQRAAALPDLGDVARLAAGAEPGGFVHAQWFALIVLAALSVLLLPRQFQMMVVECVDERHLRHASWAFPAYLFLINLFVLPIAVGGMLYFGPDAAEPDAFVLMLPLAEGARALALLVYIGGVSAATGMLIVETVAVSTMVCNDLVMPALFRWRGFGLRARGDLTRLLLNIRRAAILGILLLGYLYFRIAGGIFELVSIGLISFAAVAQFAPALLGGMFWKGGTLRGALAGLVGGFLVWAYTLMAPTFARSGWISADFVEHGPWGMALLAPERLLGLEGLDNLTHALFWSLLVNAGLYVGLSLWRAPGAREASQALLFVDIMKHDGDGEAPVFWRGRARTADLEALAVRVLGEERGGALFSDRPHGAGPLADAQLVDRVERRLAGAVGSASARVMVASVVEEESLGMDDVIAILKEATELRAANEKLRSLDQMKDDFIASVTHELRTPLTSIRALSELMLDTPDMEEEQRAEFLAILVSESERLSRLVGQVLDLAKLESGEAEWQEGEVDMKALIGQALAAMAAVFAERGIEVATDLQADAPSVRGDPDRLTQVLLNLLSNAAKFAPQGKGRIAVSLKVDRGALEVAVTDNGPGVPAADQAHVFDRFRQAGDAATRPPGTGLGLPISRRIVNHLGGEMWLRSEPGKGACFGFRLPLPGGQENERDGTDRRR